MAVINNKTEAEEYLAKSVAEVSTVGREAATDALRISAANVWRLAQRGWLDWSESWQELWRAAKRNPDNGLTDDAAREQIGAGAVDAQRSERDGAGSAAHAAPVAGGAPSVEAEPSSWAPFDLGPYLRGEVEPPTPTVGIARADGQRLIYPGREHTVMGEMESGKTWWSAACAVAELLAGCHVVYVHFEESEPADTVGRLLALGAPADAIAERFRFVGPNEPVSALALARLLDPAPSLVVLDGINEGMSLHRLAVREEDGASEFRRRLVKPCTAVGAAVLGCDHVVKDHERRGRGPIGSVHKGNALSGVLIELTNAEPFGRGRRGRSHVTVNKDRPGQLRQHGRPDRNRPGVTYMGTLVVDDTREHVSYLDLAFLAPPDDEPGDAPTPATQSERDDERVLVAVGKIAEAGQEPTLTKVRAEVGGRNSRTDDAIARLTIDGRLVERDGKRQARVFTLPQPTVPQDQTSDDDDEPV